MDKGFFTNHSQWPAVEEITRVLHHHGHQVVLAGGCVRDALLKVLAQDLDIATNATPEQVESYFPKVVPVGKSFGVCRVVIDSHTIEVATFREESEYRDGRRPEKIQYSVLEKDAFRRDFTVNAMFFDLQKNQVIDLTGGERDLAARVLRAVGVPVDRFSEDYLRIIRGARFATQLNFEIEPKTLQAMQQLASQVKNLSQERITEELRKVFKTAEPARFFTWLETLGILDLVLFKMNSVERSTLQTFFAQKIENEVLAWAALTWIHQRSGGDLQKSIQWLKDKKLSNEIVAQVKDILSSQDFFTSAHLAPDKELPLFVTVMRTGVAELAREFWERVGLLNAGRWQVFVKKYTSQGRLPQALVGGEDLKKLSVSSGPKFKELLDAAYYKQLEAKSSKEDLLLFLKDQIKN